MKKSYIYRFCPCGEIKDIGGESIEALPNFRRSEP